MHAIAHGSVETHTKKESSLKVDSTEKKKKKNRLPHRGIEPASSACRTDAVPIELHPHPDTGIKVRHGGAMHPLKQNRYRSDS